MNHTKNPKRILPEECEHAWSNLSQNEKQAVVAVLMELQRARNKHPQWPEDRIHRAGVVGEETGELLAACIQYQYEGKPKDPIIIEAIHVGATALRFIIETN